MVQTNTPLKSFYLNLASSGIKADTPVNLKNKLTVFNHALILIFLINLFYLFVGLINGFYLGCISTFFSLISVSISISFVRNNKPNAAFHFTMIYAFLFISSFSWLFGKTDFTYLYFMFLPVAGIVIFDNNKTTTIYLVSTCLITLLNLLYMENFPPYYTIPPMMKYLGYPNVVFALLLIFLGMKLFKIENLRYAKLIEEQKKIVEEKNTEMTDSIHYAKKIQIALMPPPEKLSEAFPNNFVLLLPKDIVSGDFYWFAKTEEHFYCAVADCTGHGVPGGFMTMLGLTFLDEIVNQRSVINPAEILNELREKIINTLRQSGTPGESKDGMDITIWQINSEKTLLHYAAANNPLYLMRGQNLITLKADKQPCGFHLVSKPFTLGKVELQPEDCIYAFSDGYPDQFGGEKGKKFKYKKLEELLLSTSSDLKLQKQTLTKTFQDWKGSLDQVDDILIIGMRI